MQQRKPYHIVVSFFVRCGNMQAPAGTSALHFACSELSAVAGLLGPGGEPSLESVQRAIRGLWAVTQIVGKAARDDAEGASFSLPLASSGERACDVAIAAVCHIVAAIRREPGYTARPDLYSVLVAAVLMLGVLGHSPLGKDALRTRPVAERVHVFEAICGCTEDSCPVRARAMGMR